MNFRLNSIFDILLRKFGATFHKSNASQHGSCQFQIFRTVGRLPDNTNDKVPRLCWLVEYEEESRVESGFLSIPHQLNEVLLFGDCLLRLVDKLGELLDEL